MQDGIESFEEIFEELQFELDEDPTPVGSETEKKKEAAPESKIIVPESEEDFIKQFGGSDDDDDDELETDLKDGEDSEDPAEEDEDDDQEDGSSEYFKAVGEGLFKLGKFGEVPKDFKWTQETFLEKFEELAEQNANSKIEEMLSDKWGSEGIRMFEDIFIKKVPVREYLSAYADAETYANVDIDKVSNQKAIIKAYLESMGVDEEEIYEQIDLLEEKEKLKDRAEKYREKLIEDRTAMMDEMSKKREAQIAAQKEADKARYLKISQTVSEAIKAKEINGIPLSVDDSKELLRYVTAPAYRLRDGREITELDKKLLEMRNDPVKWVALGKLLKEDLNVTPIKNKGKDESGDEIFFFTKSKKTPKSSDVGNQLDLLFSRRKK